MPGVCAVVSNDAKHDLSGSWLGAVGAAVPPAGEGPCGSLPQPGLAGRTAWTLAVQTGCDEACSYCIIPRTRGRGRSLPVHEVVTRVGDAAGHGYREVVLTGVHLGSYGRDLVPATSLEALLRRLAVHAETLGVRVRLSSIEPMDCSDAVIDLVADSACYAPHFHVPLQHASGRVLDAMRRPYTPAQYAHVVDRIRARMPRAAIGADVIVGFPGEQDADVDALCDYLSGSPLTSLHVFPFSDRPGTDAASIRPKVHGTTVRDRAARVRSIGERLQERFRADQVGSEHRAITLDDGTLALTGHYCKVKIPPGHRRNEWVRVRITGAAPVMTGDVLV